MFKIGRHLHVLKTRVSVSGEIINILPPLTPPTTNTARSCDGTHSSLANNKPETQALVYKLQSGINERLLSALV